MSKKFLLICTTAAVFSYGIDFVGVAHGSEKNAAETQKYPTVVPAMQKVSPPTAQQINGKPENANAAIASSNPAPGSSQAMSSTTSPAKATTLSSQVSQEETKQPVITAESMPESKLDASKAPTEAAQPNVFQDFKYGKYRPESHDNAITEAEKLLNPFRDIIKSSEKTPILPPLQMERFRLSLAIAEAHLSYLKTKVDPKFYWIFGKVAREARKMQKIIDKGRSKSEPNKEVPASHAQPQAKPTATA